MEIELLVQMQIRILICIIFYESCFAIFNTLQTAKCHLIRLCQNPAVHLYQLCCCHNLCIIFGGAHVIISGSPLQAPLLEPFLAIIAIYNEVL